MLQLPRIFIKILITFAFAALSVSAFAADDPYITDLTAALSQIEQGNYDRAVEPANSALARRGNDPLAHLVLGTIFLHTRQVDKAFKEFTIANTLSRDDALASYGFGIYYLAKGDCPTAKKYVLKASSNADFDTNPTLWYISAVSGASLGDAVSTADPAAAIVAAQGLIEGKKYNEAAKILSSLVSNHRNFEEQSGSVITFDRANPIGLTGRGLAKPYKAPAESEPGLKKFKGSVTLKANLTRAQGVAYVLFYVDDSLLGMVNQSPYECRWDTAKYSNAPHTVKIQGIGQSGETLSEKTIRVVVGNDTTPGSEPLPIADVKQIREKLWQCLQIKPSYRLAYYMLAKCAEAQGDGPTATDALEHLVAMDPEYRDARHLLIARYSPIPKYEAIWQVKTKQKIAAITFDDGPNPRTSKILDILKSKGVKATFFVVGQMAEANPDMLKRMASDGHELELHTYSHRNLQRIPDIEIEKELIANAAVIRDITGKSAHFFRPPGGHPNNDLGSTGGRYGYRSVFWTINCSKNEGTKRDNIVNQVSSKVTPGCIILMHNVEDVTVQALPKVIDALRAKGYKLVTLSEMVSQN